MADIEKVIRTLQDEVSRLYLENIVLKQELQETTEKLLAYETAKAASPLADPGPDPDGFFPRP